MSNVINNRICEYVFKKGNSKGQMCLKNNCKTHDEYNFNLAVFLNLPDFFVSDGKKIPKHEYLMLRNNLENISYDKSYLIKFLGNLITSMDFRDNIRVKQILAIYVYTFLDSKPVTDLILCNDNFKKVVDKKFKEFTEHYNNNSEFGFYMLNKFVIGKRFLSIKKNSEYKTRMFRVYMKTLVICQKWYDHTIEKRYAPGGNGAIDAEKNFAYLVKWQSTA